MSYGFGTHSDFEKELENLQVPTRFFDIISPGIESMTPQKDPVGGWIAPERIRHSSSELGHVLGIL